MTAKEYMIGLKNLKTLIKTKEDELKELSAISDGAPKSGSGGVRVSPDGTPPFVKTIERKEQLERFINSRIDELFDKWYESEKALAKMNSPLYEAVLCDRYINNKSWEMIADELHYSVRQVQRFHGDALIALEDVMKCP